MKSESIVSNGVSLKFDLSVRSANDGQYGVWTDNTGLILLSVSVYIKRILYKKNILFILQLKYIKIFGFKRRMQIR